MAFFRIKEAASRVGVLPHVLRFWESQFPSIKPSKTSRGQRLYTDEDIQQFLKIKYLLYTEGYSIPGAKKALKRQRTEDNARVGQSEEALSSIYKPLLEDFHKELSSLRNFVRSI